MQAPQRTHVIELLLFYIEIDLRKADLGRFSDLGRLCHRLVISLRRSPTAQTPTTTHAPG